MGEYIKIECGVFATISFRDENVFPYIYWGLRAQNHRGHQSHGFLTCKDGKFYVKKNLDLIPRVRASTFKEWLKKLPGPVGMGNVRYTTSGREDEESLLRGTQPVFACKGNFKVAISFNGNVVNALSLSKELRREFPEFHYESDAEAICHKLLAELHKSQDIETAVETCMKDIEGAFSVATITGNGEIFAFKDPHGIRPLCAGHCEENKIYAFSSETVGLDINGFQRDFEIEPGELVIVSESGFERRQLVKERKAFCAFEFAYFARPDSRFNDKHVYEIREEFGRNLVRENPEIVKNADIIISMPETGDDAALGVHEESGLRWERATRRHRYVTDRAFILLNNERYLTINKKINILGSKVKGKRVIVVDDSIVRGDTTRITVEKLRKMGAEKVYLFITFPRIIGPCFYGIDMATYSQLIGAKHTPEEIAKIIGADAVCYQSIEGFIRATGFRRDELCLGCITGEYPTPLAQKIADEMKKKFMEGYKEDGRLYEIIELN
ncbi:MAG: amidophosphoribosyltransferase [Candidatus Bathyarchaeia archaeon]